MIAPDHRSLTSRRRFFRSAAVASIVIAVLIVAMSRTTRAQFQSAGGAVNACAHERDVAVRLSRDMFRLDDKIQKLQEQAGHLREARKNPELQKRAEEANRDLAVDSALLVSKSAEFRNALKKLPLTRAARAAIELVLDGLDQAYDKFYKTPQAVKDLTQAEVNTLTKKVATLHRFLLDSGAYEKLGDKAVEKARELAFELVKKGTVTSYLGAGFAETAAQVIEGVTSPVAGLVLAEGEWAIDKIYADGLSSQNLDDENAVTDTLNVLRRQKNEIVQQATFVLVNCPVGQPQKTEPSPDSPKPIPPPDAKKDDTKGAPRQGGMGTGAKIGLAAGLGAGTAVGLWQLDKYLETLKNDGSKSGGSSGSSGSGSGSSGPSLTITSVGTFTCGSATVAGNCQGSLIVRNNRSSLVGLAITALTDPNGLVGHATLPAVGNTTTVTFSPQANARSCPPTQTAVGFFRPSENNSFAFITQSIPITCR